MQFCSKLPRKCGAIALILAFYGCGGSHATRTNTTPSVSDDTTLGAGDVFDVRVFGEQDLSSSYRVAQDGTIDFPLIGRIKVAGLEPTAVADEIASKLQSQGQLRSPQVSVFVKDYNSKRISVMGAVQHPGTFPITSGLTVVQAISLAGGFTSIASENNTVITRRTQGQLQRFRIPIQDVTEGHSDDFVLRAGDIVYVPERVF